MANKPIWIACPENMKADILKRFTGGCPRDINGLEQYGDTQCTGTSCREHWLQFIDFMDDSEEEGDKE